MKIRTQNGFWATVAIVAVIALYAANAAGGTTDHSLTKTLIAFPFIIAFFLWPVARNFFQVWRASMAFKSHDLEASRLGISSPPASQYREPSAPCLAAPSRRLEASRSVP